MFETMRHHDLSPYSRKVGFGFVKDVVLLDEDGMQRGGVEDKELGSLSQI